MAIMLVFGLATLVLVGASTALLIIHFQKVNAAALEESEEEQSEHEQDNQAQNNQPDIDDYEDDDVPQKDIPRAVMDFEPEEDFLPEPQFTPEPVPAPKPRPEPQPEYAQPQQAEQQPQTGAEQKPSSPQETIIELFKKSYASAAKILKIPSDAATVLLHIGVFGMSERNIQHFCWANESNVYFFPQWQSIEQQLTNRELRKYVPGNEHILVTLTIALDSIEFWKKLSDGTIEIHYISRKKQAIEMLLDKSVITAFKKFMPEKELAYVMKNIYPKSSQQIFDMTEEIDKLKALHKSGKLTDEEFEIAKWRILTTI